MGPYAHAIAVPSSAVWLVVSGQTGVDDTGSVVAGGIESQTRQIFRNLGGVLASAGYGFADVVKFTTYLTDSALIGAFRATRDQSYAEHFPDGAYPASTLAIVTGLARPMMSTTGEACRFPIRRS
jgi:enamine deaminase RidA (YjgF/YER057c/UK114 family)